MERLKRGDSPNCGRLLLFPILIRQVSPLLRTGVIVVDSPRTPPGFVGYAWFQQVRATGAHVLCRVRSNASCWHTMWCGPSCMMPPPRWGRSRKDILRPYRAGIASLDTAGRGFPPRVRYSGSIGISSRKCWKNVPDPVEDGRCLEENVDGFAARQYASAVIRQWRKVLTIGRPWRYCSLSKQYLVCPFYFGIV